MLEIVTDEVGESDASAIMYGRGVDASALELVNEGIIVIFCNKPNFQEQKRLAAASPLIITNLKRTNLQMQLTINPKQYEKNTDAKLRGFWANPKGLTDFLICLLRQGG